MHESLVLKIKDDIKKCEDIITVNGKDYFDTLMYPEMSGIYEVLSDPDSHYRELVRAGLFIPVMYYDAEESSWYYCGHKVNIKDYDVIGWRQI